MGTRGYKHTEETKKKISIASKSRPSGATGKHWKLSNETKQKMSLARKGEKRPYQSGERNGNWRGGVSAKYKTEKQIFMQTIEYKEWRRAVFKRDKYTCIKCGDSKGGNLEADHIKAMATHPHLSLQVKNGRTLCKKCHIKRTSKQLKTMWSNQFGKSKHFISTD